VIASSFAVQDCTMLKLHMGRSVNVYSGPVTSSCEVKLILPRMQIWMCPACTPVCFCSLHAPARNIKLLLRGKTLTHAKLWDPFESTAIYLSSDSRLLFVQVTWYESALYISILVNLTGDASFWTISLPKLASAITRTTCYGTRKECLLASVVPCTNMNQGMLPFPAVCQVCKPLKHST